jgi:hypothetical protein
MKIRDAWRKVARDGREPCQRLASCPVGRSMRTGTPFLSPHIRNMDEKWLQPANIAGLMLFN